jgi:3'-5' exonuclease
VPEMQEQFPADRHGWRKCRKCRPLRAPRQPLPALLYLLHPCSRALTQHLHIHVLQSSFRRIAAIVTFPPACSRPRRMINNVLVFDIETVPDTETGRRLYALDGLSDKDVARAMAMKRREETGESEFLRHPYHRIVAISVLLRRDVQGRTSAAGGGKPGAAGEPSLSVWSLGDPDADEAEIIRRFYDGIDKYTPTLVSWNGGGFDLPVLNYRALKHGVSAPRYWETGGSDQSFRWNNYINRFHERHTDLMDVLAGYQPRAVAPLSEVAQLLGFPGKFGLSGADVWDQYLAGRLEDIRNYCETDVLNTYLIYLRFELIRGNLDASGYDKEIALVRAMLGTGNKPHFKAFLAAWESQAAKA